MSIITLTRNRITTNHTHRNYTVTTITTGAASVKFWPFSMPPI
jgi:hypothetical protein